MKKYIVLFLIIFASFTEANAGCDHCYSNYNETINMADEEYVNDLSAAFNTTLIEVVSQWGGYATGGAKAVGGWNLLSGYDYFDPYWGVIRAEKTYWNTVGKTLTALQFCLAVCGG